MVTYCRFIPREIDSTVLRATEIMGVLPMVTIGDLRGNPNLLLCLEIQLSLTSMGTKCAEAASIFC